MKAEFSRRRFLGTVGMAGMAACVGSVYGCGAPAREFGPKGLHVGHVVIDGGIDGDALNERFPQFKEQRGEDGMLNIDAIADAYWALHRQDPSAWTLELDLRPYKEVSSGDVFSL